MTFGAPTLKCLVFDLDGVITDTARVHASAWEATFNEVMFRFEAKASSKDVPDPFPAHQDLPGLLPKDGKHRPFTSDDYHHFVDGKPRYDGVRDFLKSRDISLPEGESADEAGFGTVCAVGNLKNNLLTSVLESDGVSVYPATARLMAAALKQGIAVSVASSSKNARPVLKAAGLMSLVDAVVDGTDAERLKLPGKPRPHIFVEAARACGATPAEAVVFEDAVSGVAAGAAGRFRLVIGLDRGLLSAAAKSDGTFSGEVREGAKQSALAEHADVVVPDVSTLCAVVGHKPHPLQPVAPPARYSDSKGASTGATPADARAETASRWSDGDAFVDAVRAAFETQPAKDSAPAEASASPP
eukprot:TRINITY_DN12184_c0_g1_i1.p1 TRINITY_DN12184_c0_g1~~TRINITY_DN12184_c0_g1_i1.p1  ORF type:complete len:357 (+),score=67.60 TRINITY_DN12184_c0_g1_i1:97-1167(+)